MPATGNIRAKGTSFWRASLSKQELKAADERERRCPIAKYNNGAPEKGEN